MTTPPKSEEELREEIQAIVVNAIADGIDAYEDTGTFPPVLGFKATDEIMHLISTHSALAVEEAVRKPYEERAQLVAALTKVYPSYIATDDNEPDWMVVCIHTPNGQAGWHISARDRKMFKHLPTEPNHYDGHTGKEKYRRLLALNNKGSGGGDE